MAAIVPELDPQLPPPNPPHLPFFLIFILKLLCYGDEDDEFIHEL